MTIKYNFKILLLFISAFLLGFSGNAFNIVNLDKNQQPDKIIPIKSTANQFGIGIKTGLTFPFTDFTRNVTAPIIGGALFYQALPYLQITGELEMGWLKGDQDLSENYNLKFNNRFYSARLSGQVFPFKLRKYPKSKHPVFLDYIYVGAGFSFLKNRVQLISNDGSKENVKSGYSGLLVLIPAELGMRIPIYTIKSKKNQLITLELTYLQNFNFSDNLDGYYPNIPANKNNDTYSQFTCGLSYRF